MKKESLAYFYEKLANQEVRCYVCPRHCLIGNMKRGFCGVRSNIEGILYHLTYNKIKTLQVSAIEKKLLFHFLPDSKTLTIGTVGSNLLGDYSQHASLDSLDDIPTLISDFTPQRIVNLARDYKCNSVVFTESEPVVGVEFIMDTAKKCRDDGLHTVAVTSGYMDSTVRPYFFKHISAVYLDIKSFRDEFYVKYFDSHLLPVLDTFDYIHNETSCWIEVGTLLIPNLNDSSTEIAEFSEWLINHGGSHIPFHINAFNATTSVESLIHAKTIANQVGLINVYCGNVGHSALATTYCYGCQKKLIERQGLNVVSNLAKKGVCPECKSALGGVYLE